jgi:hypothetical protein
MKNFVSVTVATLLLAHSNVSAGPLFVCAGCANPVPPFANWATAATNIQQALDAAAAGAEVVVTNGIYEAVNVDKPLLVRSVHGPQVTIIDAARLGRCAWLTNGTSLAGFWLRHGAADNFGGGVFCASSDVYLTNCMITDNSALSYSNGVAIGSGGGVYGGTLYNCLVASNSAAFSGGGASASALYNCTVIDNRANRYGGGVYGSALANCIVYFNLAVMPYNDHCLASFNHSCTAPMPTNGVGNTTSAPQFVNHRGGDLRLLGSSPCMDKGDNGVMNASVDLAGNPRIIRDRVDMGAYEFQGTNSAVFYAWLPFHGIVPDGTTDYQDPDGDGMNNWQEWFCYTCPTNALDALRMVSAEWVDAYIAVRWQSSPGKDYFVERSTNLTSSFTVLVTNFPASMSGKTLYTDSHVQGRGPFFYRVGIKDVRTGAAVVCQPVKSGSRAGD